MPTQDYTRVYGIIIKESGVTIATYTPEEIDTNFGRTQDTVTVLTPSCLEIQYGVLALKLPVSLTNLVNVYSDMQVVYNYFPNRGGIALIGDTPYMTTFANTKIHSLTTLYNSQYAFGGYESSNGINKTTLNTTVYSGSTIADRLTWLIQRSSTNVLFSIGGSGNTDSTTLFTTDNLYLLLGNTFNTSEIIFPVVEGDKMFIFGEQLESTDSKHRLRDLRQPKMTDVNLGYNRI